MDSHFTLKGHTLGLVCGWVKLYLFMEKPTINEFFNENTSASHLSRTLSKRLVDLASVEDEVGGKHYRP